ncbi:MAG: DUF5362 family protein [Candidatus Woesearchaeota archaeon]
MNSILDDCKLSPTLADNENIFFSTYISLGNSIRSNIIIILTNFNLFVRHRKGINVEEKFNELSNLDVKLSNISKIRISGSIIKKIEIETLDNNIISLENGSTDFQELISKIVEIEHLQQSDWGEETNATQITKNSLGATSGIFGFLIGIFGFLIGLLFVFVGFLFTLTIIGALFGIPMILVGLSILTGTGFISGGLFKGSSYLFNKNEEWIRR